MKFLSVLILVLLVITLSAYSQEVMKPLKWVVRPSFGLTFPITKLSGGHITDQLVGFGGVTYYGQFISTTYFFNRWGIEFSFAGNYSSKLDGRHDRFIAEVEKKYSGNYFVSPSSGGIYLPSNIVGGAIGKGSLGPVYKVEKNRFVLIGRAMIGSTSFDTDWGSASLKGKGTNELINIDWKAGKSFKEYFTFNPSFTLGYRLFDRVVLDFDLNYWIYNIDFEYWETIENMHTKAISTQHYAYSNLINEFGVGFGLMIVLK